MKIITLIENKAGRNQNLYHEHGISFYTEAYGKKILFDTGQSGDFIDNAKALKVDLHDLDYVVLSHGHYDHSGGFMRLVEKYLPRFTLVLGERFFKEKYSLLENGAYRYTGNPFETFFLNENNISTVYINQDIKYIEENIAIFTNFLGNPDFENINKTMFIKEKEGYELDPFTDEIALGIYREKGWVIFVGCSHVGIVNILETIEKRTGQKIYALVGGIHLVKEEEKQINKIIDYLKEKNIKIIGACHCTGKQGETMLGQQLEGEFIKNHTGDILEI